MTSQDRSVLSRPARRPDAVLRYGDDPEQVIDLRLPASRAPAPLAVVVHGGFWRPDFDRTHAAAQSAGLADAGWVVATVEYRRGERDQLVDDALRAMAAAPRLAAAAAPGRVDPGRTVLVGHSAGGHLVLLGAQRPGLATGVVALAPVTDLVAAERDDLDGGAVRAFLGGPAAEHPGLDPARLPSPRLPVVLVHGAADDRVPVTQSTDYARAHPAVTVDVLPGTGHFALIDPRSAAWPRVLAAAEQASGGATTLA